MIETVVALVMLMENQIPKYYYQPDISQCLKAKRIVERNEPNASYQCIVSKAEVVENEDGSKSIIKLVKSKDDKFYQMFNNRVY